jgi:hypothetical protein
VDRGRAHTGNFGYLSLALPADAQCPRQSGSLAVLLLPFNGNIYVTIKNMSFQIKELLKADGDSPFADWFGSLEV